MLRVVLAVAAVGLVVSGCATKRYGRMTALSGVEAQMMSCREIEMEEGKVEAFRYQVATGAKIDWRSVAGFLGDYGIGNAMEKNDAERSATLRMTQLQKLAAEKGCKVSPASL